MKYYEPFGQINVLKLRDTSGIWGGIFFAQYIVTYLHLEGRGFRGCLTPSKEMPGWGYSQSFFHEDCERFVENMLKQLGVEKIPVINL